MMVLVLIPLVLFMKKSEEEPGPAAISE